MLGKLPQVGCSSSCNVTAMNASWTRGTENSNSNVGRQKNRTKNSNLVKYLKMHIKDLECLDTCQFLHSTKREREGERFPPTAKK